MIVDYKSTSKDEKIEALDKEWHDGYKHQMEVYQWLFRRNGFKVSDTGYFVYANASKDNKSFDGKLEFEVTLIAHKGDDSWVEGTLLEIKRHSIASYCPHLRRIAITAPIASMSGKTDGVCRKDKKPKGKILGI